AATPFLAGGGDRGWRANFDWFISGDTNIQKVLEGCYEQPRYDEPAATRAAACRSAMGRRAGAVAEVYAGAGPTAAASGARVKPATLERIRAREAALEQRMATGAALGV